MIPRRIFVLIDTILIVIAFRVAYAITPHLHPLLDPALDWLIRAVPSLGSALRPEVSGLAPLSNLWWILIVIVPTALLVLIAVDAYGQLRRMSRTRVLLAGPLASVAALGATTLVIFTLKIPQWSRLLLFTFAAATAILLTSVRAFIRAYHSWQTRAGYYVRNALLVGPEEYIRALEACLSSHSGGIEYRFVGFLLPSDGGDDALLPRSVGAAAARGVAEEMRDRDPAAREVSPTIPCLGTVADLEPTLVSLAINEIVVAATGRSGGWVEDVLLTCDRVGVSVRLIPEVLMHGTLRNLVVGQDLQAQLQPAVLLTPRAFNTDALHAKRLLDVIGSVAGLLALAPLLGVIVTLVRMSGPGPIFYRWQVVGQNGRRFTGYKFRTMVSNADELKLGLWQQNEMKGPVFKIKNDPRITRIGHWLRKYSLDELPQLWSVLKGDMSLVGPRPALPTEFARYAFWQCRKLSIRPGITCLWQVRGRNVITDFDDWVKLDLEYIDTWSLWLDFKILARTAVAVVKGTGR